MIFSPFNVEDLVAAAVDALKIKGDARAITVLVSGDCSLDLEMSDFGINFWQIIIALPIGIFYAMSDDERKATESSIAEAIAPFYTAEQSDSLSSVVIAPKVGEAAQGWREEAMRYVKGEGVTNQGRVRSDNIASQQHQGLLFRSQAEVTLFKALVKAKLAVAPLPVFVRVGNSYNRLEPDFVIVYKGLTFVVEVDGDTYHRELPAEADKRLVPLTYEGVEVRRIRAAELLSDEQADKAVKGLMQFMAQRKASR